jgi:hypothetical protein
MTKALFIWIPRTGGTSVWGAIQRSGKTYSRMNEKRELDPDAEICTLQHSSIQECIKAGVITQDWVSNRYVFTIVRNPWERLLSIYTKFNELGGKYQKALHGMSFEEYITHICTKDIPKLSVKSFDGLNYCNPAAAWINNISCVNIFRTEELDICWPTLSERLGIDIPLGHAFASKHGGVHEHYTMDMIELVRNKYGGLYE